MDVSILGGDPDRTRIAVDGARVNDSVDGGTQQNFSQEIVQEFQISSVNFDLSTGITAAGAINIVTRSGSNQLHGSGFFFFRDHHMAAYPGPAARSAGAGSVLRAPAERPMGRRSVVKDRLFFFAAYEHNNQRGVFTSVPTRSRVQQSGPRHPQPQARRSGQRPHGLPLSAPPTPHSCATPTMATTPSRRAKSTPAIGLGEQRELGRFRRVLADQQR